MTPKKISCGCEISADRLVSVCSLHADYLRQHVEAARAPRGTVDKQLQRELVVAIAPLVVSQHLNDPERISESRVAEKIHDQVHEIMRRMD